MRMRTDAPLDPWRIIVYNKGSWILHMLRRRMGDTNFLAMLGAIRKRYAYQPFNTDQFRVIAAEFSPKGIPDSTLDNFFDNWVYSTGVPTLEFSSSVKGKAPQVQVSVSVRQTGVTDEFSIDVPVEIRVPGQAQPIVKWVRTGPDPATFTLKLKAAPTKVELAPGAGVLAFRK
jgi:aminopeptidase N